MDTFTENYYLQVHPLLVGKEGWLRRKNQEPRGLSPKKGTGTTCLARFWNCYELVMPCPFRCPSFKWECLEQLCYTYPTIVCQVCGGQRAGPLSSQFFNWMECTQEAVTKKMHLRSFMYIMTWSGWQVPGMLMPNWNETKGSLERGWVHCAWERDISCCSQRVRDRFISQMWLHQEIPSHMFLQCDIAIFPLRGNW